MAKKSRKPATPYAQRTGREYRPNFGRQMLYAGIAVVSIFLGYYLYYQFGPKPADPHNETSSSQSPALQTADHRPWYQKQSPPPSLITTPDAPLFPEVDEHQLATIKSSAAKTARAYEESLPQDTYHPPPRSVPTTEHVTQQPEQQASDPASVLPPWRRYAVKFAGHGEGPLIAIVIDDMGVDVKHSAQAIKMKAPLTLSFLTYADNLDSQTRQARANGHELMLHVSMEPTSTTVDPGPNVLLTGLDEAELNRRLEWGFSRFNGYVGINNHMGSKFTADTHAMGLVIDAVKNRGLLFLDSRTSGGTVGGKLARQKGVPLAERNIFIDHVNNLSEVNARLKDVEKFASRNGYVVAIGHPRQATLEALSVWLEDVQSRGFRLAPLSAIVEKIGAS